MNKSLDERLVPVGEYTDALNIRISADEDGEAGSIENSKGNERMTTLEYKGDQLSSSAVCIGAFEDGANETIYWFVTDQANTTSSTGVVDMIVSYNTNDDAVTYHVISTSVLNFNEKYLMNGINLVDDLLFFTDNYNGPRKINTKRNYLEPTAAHADEITEDDISVIVKPPHYAPTVTPAFRGSNENYMEDKFISFAYRYRYKDGEYSALSAFTDAVFEPGDFQIDYGNYDMIGMRNSYNLVNVSFNTGSKHVDEIDVCFKIHGRPGIFIIERFNKDDQGWGNGANQSVDFNNKKIYTALPSSEIFRSFDNVPRYAKAQTSMGNRIMYGNYKDGYDIDTVLDYTVEGRFESVGRTKLIDETSDGVAYTIDTSTTITDSTLDIDLTGFNLKEGAALHIRVDIIHDSFGGDSSYPGTVENEFEFNFSFILDQDYDSLANLAGSDAFTDSIQSSLTFANAGDGYSLTDLFYAQISTDSGWSAVGGGVTSNTGDFEITTSGNVLSIQIPAIEIEDDANPGTYAYEYFEWGSVNATFLEVGSRESLHSNRDYEVGIQYMDDYNRATTVLVSNSNTVFVPITESPNKNYIRAYINHLAPSWATRYRMAVKPSLENTYDTIYSNLYFYDPSVGAWFVKLEGDNISKAKEGDNLYVKADSTGPVLQIARTRILEFGTKEANFIDDVTCPSGVYIKLRPTNYNIEEKENSFISAGRRESSGDYPGHMHPAYIEDPDAPGTYIEYDIPAGSIIKINIFEGRFGSAWLNEDEAGSRIWRHEKQYVATKDYDNLYDWLLGDNIVDQITEPTNNPAAEGSDDTVTQAEFVSGVGSATSDSGGPPGLNNINGRLQIKYYRHPSNNKAWLGFKGGAQEVGGFAFINGSPGRLGTTIEVIRSGNTLIFETESVDADNEEYYEGSQTFDISNRLHNGNISNQTSSEPGIVDLTFFNCYTFGNGDEGYKINSALVGNRLDMGVRVSAVSQQDYKEAHRYADITYSGVYNEETNINKLNQFNLGLANYKTLEKSFGPIQKLHGRQTDILVLQEDKISYVLQGKNILSDAVGGGSVTSVPEVLGTQTSRKEEYGISNNPESFASYGYDVFFTDAKRNAVINIKGSDRGETITPISSLGMRSFFRDEFKDTFNNFKLGAFDPYSNEYVLSSTDIEIEKTIDKIDCGVTIQQSTSSQAITKDIDFGAGIGDSIISYDFASGSANITIVYNGSTVINQSISGTGTVTFNKDAFGVDTARVTITPSNATYVITIPCLDRTELTVIRIVKNTEVMESETIHHEYTWSDGNYSGPTITDYVEFGSGDVSLYESQTQEESVGGSPSEGATVTMRYVKKSGDSAEFDHDKFKYLVSDTLYDSDDINTLTPLLSEASPIDNPSTDVYESSFTYNNPSDNNYLYLVWDYIEPLLECSDTINFSGGDGIYEFSVAVGTGIGDTTLTFNSIGVPDRFEIIWNGNVVADSLFVGDNLPNTTQENEITSATSLTKYVYDGDVFEDEGTESVNFTSSDIANSSTSRPTSGDGSVGNQVGVVGGYPTGTPLASDGDVKLTFNKTSEYPQTIKVRVTGVNTGTAWSVSALDCPSETTADEYVNPTQYYSQQWFWQDDVDPLGGGANYVAIAVIDGTYYLWMIGSSTPASTLLLSNADSGATLSAVEDLFMDAVGASDILSKSLYQDLAPNVYPIEDDL